MKHRSFLKGNISILFRGIKNNKKSFSRFSYHTVTLPEYQLITCDRSLFFLSPSCHTYISLWRQCDSRIIFLSRITHWNTISMTVWQEKCQKTFFVYANEKIHRQITLLYRLFFDVSYFLIITKIVAVPIQVQSGIGIIWDLNWWFLCSNPTLRKKSSVSYKKITCSCDENKEREKRKIPHRQGIREEWMEVWEN